MLALAACNPATSTTGAGGSSGGGGTASGGTGSTVSGGGGSTAGGGGGPAVQTFAVPTASAGLQKMTAGPDGALWFAEAGAGKVGRLTTSGQFTEYPVPSDNDVAGIDDSGPTTIVSSGGALWFLTQIGEGAYKMTTSGAYTREFYDETYNAVTLAPASNGGVWLMMSGGDGNSSDGGALVLVGPQGKATGYPATHDDTIYADALAPDGSAWYNDSGDALNSVNAAGTQGSHPLPDDSPAEVSSIAFTKDGTAWFTEYVPNVTDVTPEYIGCCGAVGSVSASGTHLTKIGAQDEGHGLEAFGLVNGPDGDLYFGYDQANNYDGQNGIGRIDPSTGQVAIASLNYQLTFLAAGPDGALWFTDADANLIGRINVSKLSFRAAS